MSKERRKAVATGIRGKLTAQMLLCGLAPLVLVGGFGYLVFRRSTAAFDRNLPETAQLTVTIAAQLCTLYVPTLTRLFETTPLNPGELFACLALASVVFVAVEIEKWIRRRPS